MSSERRLAIETRRLEDLTPDPDNANVHTEDQIEYLMSSIRSYGFNDPLAIDEDGVVLEGNGRLIAATNLGIAEVPVIVLTGLTADEKKGYAIAHNQTQRNTGLDEHKMRREFMDLGLADEEFMPVGFSQEEKMFLMTEADADQLPETEQDERSFVPASRGPRRTVLKFEDMRAYGIWDSFERHLSTVYADAGSLAERLIMFVDDQADLTG